MRFLITGGFGYLGSYCAEYLKSMGNKITIIGRSIPDYMEEWAKKFEVIIGDITDENLFLKVEDNKYDCAIHFAAVNQVKCKKSPKESILINTFGTENILNLCIKRGIKRVIYISTFHVYGSSNLSGLINEESNIEASNLYGMTHYFGELLTKLYALNNDLIGSSLRLANSYSSPIFKEMDRWSSVPNNFIMQACKNRKIIINSLGNQCRNFLSIKDLCNAINIIIEKQNLKYDVFNVGGNKNYSINEIAQIVKGIGQEIINEKDIQIINNPNPYEIRERTGYIFDISKIKLMGYNPIGDINAELKETFKTFMKSGV